MNDFTKDELIIMHLALNAFAPVSNITGEVIDHLSKKLQPMIENYNKPCKHKNKICLDLKQPGVYNFCKDCNDMRHVR